VVLIGRDARSHASISASTSMKYELPFTRGIRFGWQSRAFNPDLVPMTNLMQLAYGCTRSGMMGAPSD
jgi:hypothetical protein